MALNMRRAFNSRMLTSLTVYIQEEGSYNDDNDWIPGSTTPKPVKGVVQAGNKFSQFEEGIAAISDDGGTRTSDYRSLYIHSKYGIELEDKVEFKGVYYNVLQQSDESIHGFDSFLLEKSKSWRPS